MCRVLSIKHGGLQADLKGGSGGAAAPPGKKQIKYKKSRVPLSFLDNNFDVRFRLNGLMQIDNVSSLEIGYPRGVNTALTQGTE